jgi:hypothetical protein
MTPPSRRLFVVAVLLVVTLDPMLGYYLGVFNWTEYYREEASIGNTPDMIQPHFITLQPLDSIRIGVTYEKHLLLNPLWLISSEDIDGCASSVGNRLSCEWEKAAAISNPLACTDCGATNQICYTTFKGGHYVWFAGGIAEDGWTPNGTATVTISRLYLALVPGVILLAFLLWSRRKTRPPTSSLDRSQSLPVQAPISCRRCGTSTRRGSVYCRNCGTRLVD